jgi:xylan 1,4-beta-xylosidase
LSYADGKFWLVYTVVRNTGAGRPFKDLHNYLITSSRIEGPWSDPVHLNASGFDPSLFHEEDGRKWLIQMRWDFRPDRPRFAGIILQEFDSAANRLTGEVRTLLQKDRLIEGPNLYRRDGWYYLMLAEGGTGWNHGISMARSRRLEGPYELDPQDSVLTSRDDPTLPLQKAGHGELVETPDGQWYLAHLASRPLGEGSQRRCVLGRETCLQKVEWTSEGWLRLEGGGHHPKVEVPNPRGKHTPQKRISRFQANFSGEISETGWYSLRGPLDTNWWSLTERPGWLRIRGRESLHSLFEQSLWARRLESFRWRVQTCMQFLPPSFAQSAGLILWYDTRTHYYLRVTRDERRGLLVGLALTDDGSYAEPPEAQRESYPGQEIFLRAEGDRERLKFWSGPDGKKWDPIGGVLDLSRLSDDYGTGLHFTGAFAGLCVQDLDGSRLPADFREFSLENLLK